MQRITADIDNKRIFSLLESLFNTINNIEKIKRIIITPSHSKGWHIQVYTTKYYKKNEIYALRKLIGDDIQRIKLDKIHKGFSEQTLWYKKIKINNKRKPKPKPK